MFSWFNVLRFIGNNNALIVGGVVFTCVSALAMAALLIYAVVFLVFVAGPESRLGYVAGVGLTMAFMGVVVFLVGMVGGAACVLVGISHSESQQRKIRQEAREVASGISQGIGPSEVLNHGIEDAEQGKAQATGFFAGFAWPQKKDDQ
jgi:hypothetical protein